jgi:two-component system chemotaxis response regulator CheB
MEKLLGVENWAAHFPMQIIRVMIIDDSLTIRAMFEELLLADPEFKMVGALDGAGEALAVLSTALPDVIALDLNMPGLNGLDFLDAVQGHWHPMSIVLVSSAATHKSEVCKQAFARGAIACFDKSKLVANGRQLCQLLKDAASGTIHHAQHRRDGSTIPTRADLVAPCPLQDQVTP